MYIIVATKQYIKSLKKIKKSGKFPQEEIGWVIDCLARNEKLHFKYRDHELQGDLQGYRECHIKNDLLLVYKKQSDKLILVLVDIGSHSYLF